MTSWRKIHTCLSSHHHLFFWTIIECVFCFPKCPILISTWPSCFMSFLVLLNWNSSNIFLLSSFFVLLQVLVQFWHTKDLKSPFSLCISAISNYFRLLFLSNNNFLFLLLLFPSSWYFFFHLKTEQGYDWVIFKCKTKMNTRRRFLDPF